MTTDRLLLSCLSTGLLLASHSDAQAPYREIHPSRVWRVNAAGGANFVDLWQAAEAAHSRDVVLVAPGEYFGFELNGKGLTVLGEESSPGSVIALGCTFQGGAGATSVPAPAEARVPLACRSWGR